MLIKKIIN